MMRRSPRLSPPRRPGRGPPRGLVPWFKRVKRRLGYYEFRGRVRRGQFLRARRPTDVFLVGHPKSGNTWLAYMLAVLLTRDHDHRVTLVNVGEHVPFVHGRDYQIARYGTLPDPRIFRNEYPRYWDLYPKIIYLMRDPRAVLPSLWHMYQVMFDDRDLTLTDFLAQYLAMDGIFVDWNRDLVRWDRQVRSTMAEAAQGNRIHIMTYEDLVRDRRGSLERVMAFAGIERSEADLSLAVERGGFDAMRALEDRHGAEAYKDRAAGEGRFVRMGTIDSWREDVDAALVRRIEREFAPVMALAGYRVEASRSVAR